MAETKKKLSGIVATAVVTVLAIVSCILYCVNGTAEGYFKGTNEGVVVAMSVIAIVCLLGSIALTYTKTDSKFVVLLIDALRIAATALLIACLLMFISTRVQGLGYIFFSDENVLDEVQTPANMSSAYTAITGFVFYGLAWIAGIVACFMGAVKKED